MINGSRNKRDLRSKRSKRISGSESQRIKFEENDKKIKGSLNKIRRADKIEDQRIKGSEDEDQKRSKMIKWIRK